MQSPLPFTVMHSYRVEDFIVSSCNEDAFRQLSHWPEGDGRALYLYGPPGCGKTHLAHVWREKSHARFFTPGELQHFLAHPEQGGAWIVELEGETWTEEALFHLLNKTRQEKTSLLLIHQRPSAQAGFTLPDLRSRLNALPAIRVGEPDDELLAALITKLFADRQLAVAEDVTQFVLRRIERSFTAVHQVVAMLDDAALREQQRITVPFVKKHLSQT